jgi:ABC-type spermidine/putrescine transport system permease subunit II
VSANAITGVSSASSIGNLVVVSTICVLWLPSLLLLISALHSDVRPLLTLQQMTTVEFQRALNDSTIRAEVLRSGLSSLATAILCSVGGWFLGHNLRKRRPVDQIAVAAAFVPLVLPPHALAWSLDFFFERIGFSRGLGALILAHTVMFLPVALLFNWLRATQLAELPSIANNLGAPSWRVLFRVFWPHQRPTIYVTVLVVVALSMTESTVGYYVTSSEKPFAVATIQSLSGSFDATRYAAAVLVFVATTALLGGGLAAQWRLSTGGRENGAGLQ